MNTNTKPLDILNGWLDRLTKIRESPAYQRSMTEHDEEYLKNNLDFANIASKKNIKIMSRFTIESRERFALKTKSLVLYLPKEASKIKKLEEDAVLHAVPHEQDPKDLNGINVGCGDRRISEYLTPVDIMREDPRGDVTGAHHAFLKDAILGNPEDLPFKPESLDYIVALHMLEHVSNPMEILAYWATLLKPGGGIGLILPNYEYTWDATGDHSRFGHKWNTSATIFRKLYERRLKGILELERIETLKHKISFDVVLRKPGEFLPFTISNITNAYSGAELAQSGSMVSEM